MTGGSRWYSFGEMSIRLAAVEALAATEPIQLPLLPSVALRRLNFRTGVRVASLESDGIPVFPASAYIRAEADAALLAGMAARAHLLFFAEAAIAFDRARAGGNSLHIRFGAEVEIQ